MEFITILICLVVERWTRFGKQVRQFLLFQRYFNLFQKMHASPLLRVIVILLPITLVVGFVYWLLLSMWLGFFAFLLAVAVLLYCLGEFEVNERVSHEDQKFGSPADRKVGIELCDANHNIFAVIFWFLLLGPMGALFYRINDLLSHHNEMAREALIAAKIERILDWVPVRLFGFTLALVSHFMPVLQCWLKSFFANPKENSCFLTQCGIVALTDGSDDAQIQQLIDRAQIIWLVVIALIVLL